MNGVGIGAFIGALLLMVVFHEFGHYITARKFGIKVEEFFVGFGPRVFSWRRKETEYGVKAILLGGYVKIAGMNPFQDIDPTERPRTFGAKPAWQRAIVLVAGSFTHFILAFVVLTFLYSALGLQRATPQVDDVNIKVNGAQGPAESAGMKPGDRIIEIAGKPVDSWDDVRRQIRSNPNKELAFSVRRDERTLDLRITPAGTEVSRGKGAKSEQVGQIGVAPVVTKFREPLHKGILLSLSTTWEAIRGSVIGIGQIFSPSSIAGIFQSLGETEPRGPDEPVGLVGGARLAGQVTSAGGPEALIHFLSFFIVFVGVINLAPLPPLDGGHLAVLALEKITRRDIDMRKVIPVAGVVLAFFVVMTMALLYLDIVRPVTDPFQ